MRVRTALLVLLLAGCAPAEPSSGAAPPIPDLALYATPPGSGDAGQLLAQQEIGAPTGMRAWVIAYRSTGLDGEPITVTGTVVAPSSAGSDRPLVTLGHWSVGLADACAPSRGGLRPGSTLVAVGLAFVQRGAAVVATDYPGLGTPGPHPFLVGASEGRAMLDGARAARQLADAGAGARIATVGHSQGGQAALWAGELAASYAPELALVGVAAISPVGDLAETARVGFEAAGTRSGWVNAAELVASWRETFGLADDAILTPEGRRVTDALANACPARVEVTGPTIAADPLDDPAWAARLAEQSAGMTPVGAPVLMVHGLADDLVPVSSSRLVRDRLCAAGDPVTLDELEGFDHVLTILGRGRVDAAVDWVESRFAGTSVTDDCPI